MQLVSVDSDSVPSTRVSKDSFSCDKLSGECVPENMDLDKAITLTRYGRFQCSLLFGCAFCLMSVGLQNNLSAYVLPAAHCELHLNSREIGFINAAFLVGGTCSSFLWGVVGDVTGRKKLLVTTLFLDFIITVLCSLMQNFAGLIVCRFFNGFLIGAPGSLTFTYLAEFHAPHHRSKSIYYSAGFYTLSLLFLPTAAWFILPLKVQVTFQNFVLCSSWRIFLLLLAIPELVASVCIWYLPESPKYLATKHPEKALAILKHMFAVNTGKDQNLFPVKRLTHITSSNCGANNVNCRGKIARIFEDIYNQIRKLLKAPLLSLSVIASAIMFSNMFGFFGLGLWLPELLTRIQEFQKEYPNATVTLRQLTNMTRADNGTDDDCSPTFDTTLFQSTMAMGVCALLGNILSGWCAGNFQHKIIPFVTMFLGAVSTAGIYWVRSSLQSLIAASIFQATMSTANIAVGTVVVELFPTSVNAIAICTAMFVGRIGAIISNVIFGFLMDFNCEIAVLLVAVILMVGTGLCLLIPNGDKENKSTRNETSPNNINSEPSVISVTSM